jgi:DNA invertase Pin-like site-specific DNA recombinase
VIVGYGRTSTVEQRAGLDAQVRDLLAAGSERVFAEQVSAAAERPELAAMLAFVREGDVVVVTRADRLARSTSDLLSIIASLERKHVGLRVLAMGGAELDTQSPTGRLLLTVLAAIAEFEKALMIERQREGIARAKAERRYRGRAPTAQRKAREIVALRSQGVGPSEIARRLRLSRSSVHSILKAAKEPTTAPVASTAASTTTPQNEAARESAFPDGHR